MSGGLIQLLNHFREEKIHTSSLNESEKSEAQKELSDLTPATGSELANASIKLPSGETRNFFISLQTFRNEKLSEYPLIRIRLYDPQKGKEEFRVLSFERDLKQKDAMQKFVIVDRTDPKSRKVLGEAPSEDEILSMVTEEKEKLFENKIINSFVSQRSLILSGFTSDEISTLKAEPIKLSFLPTDKYCPLLEQLSFTFQVPKGKDTAEGKSQSVDIEYYASLSRLLSEVGVFFSDHYSTEPIPDKKDPSIITQKITVNSDAVVTITYFGEDEKTKTKVYNLELKRFDEIKPISSLQIVEEISGRITLHTYSSYKGTRIETELGKVTEKIDFQKLADKYNSGEKLSPTEKLILDKLLKSTISYPRKDTQGATSLVPNDDSYGDAFLPIHLKALQYARERARNGASIVSVFQEIFQGIGIPWQYNGLTRILSFENPKEPVKPKKE